MRPGAAVPVVATLLAAALVAGAGTAAAGAGVGEADAGAGAAAAGTAASSAAAGAGTAASSMAASSAPASDAAAGAGTIEMQGFSVAESLSSEVDTTGAARGSCVGWWEALLARFKSAELADTGKRVRTKATFVDAAKYTEGQTIGELMADPEAASEVFLTQLEWKSALYEFGDAEWYAAKLDVVRKAGVAGEAKDSVFARDTYDGQVVDGVVYDAESGIAYIPKSAVDGYTPADEVREQGCAMQAQLLFTADAATAGKTVAGEARVVDAETGESFTAATAGSFLGNEVFVQIASAEDAAKVDPQSIAVRVNDGASVVAGASCGAGGGAAERNSAGQAAIGQEAAAQTATIQADATVAGYDASTGVLGVSVPAAAAAGIEVCYRANGADAPSFSDARATLMSSVSEMECVPGVEFSGLDLERIGEGWTFGSTVYVDASGSGEFSGRDVDHVYYPTPLDGNVVTQQAWDGMNAGSNFERIGDRYPSGSRIAYNMSFLIPEDENGNVNIGLNTGDYKYGIENGWTVKSLRISHEDAGNTAITSLDWRFSDVAGDGQRPCMRMFSAICTHASNPFDFAADGGICTSYTKVVAIDREASTITLAFMANLGGDNGGQTCSQVARFSVKKVPKKGWIELQKKSASENITDGNACYKLEGAVYGVYADETCTQQVAELVTDAAGYAKSGELDIGEYWVKESSAPQGYALDVQAHGVAVRGDETSRVESADLAQNNPVDLVLHKVDRETGKAVPQGSASLAGAEFTVSYYDGYHEAGSLPKNPTRRWVLRTDANGQARLDDAHKASGDTFYRNSAGTPCVPLGTVSVQETKAPAGYLLGEAGLSVQQIRGAGAKATQETVEAFNVLEVPDQVVRGGVEVFKRDAELGASEALGGCAHDGGDSKEHSSLAGIVFTITNTSAHDVRVDGVDYGRGKVVKTIATAWDEERKAYRAATELDCLPYGDYEIAETSTTRSYLLSDGGARSFQIRENGAYASFGNVFSNYVARNDLRLQKKGEGSSEALAHVPFALVNEATGETHVVVTDENGTIDTAGGLARHSTATNAFDALLSGVDAAAGGSETAGSGEGVGGAPSLAAVKALVNSGTRISAAAIDAAGEPGRAGTWFGRGEDGGQAAVDDGRGALPYGNYLLYELPCEANEGYRLFSTQLSIYADVSVFARGYDLGTVVDYRTPQPPSLHTTATDAADGDKFLVAGGTARIVDTVAYGNLEPGESYRLEGVLVDKETGAPVCGTGGEEMAASLEFEAPVTDGHVEVAFDIDTSGLAGHALVVFETLFCGEEQIAAHADIDDAGQTVRVVSLQTRLAQVKAAAGGAEGGEKGTADTSGETDANEGAGDTKGADKADETNDGEAAAGENANGGDGEGDAGQTAGEEGAADTDARESEGEDEMKSQEGKLLEAGVRVVLVDTVSYTGLAAGQTYTVAGVLMDKETGAPALDAGGEEMRGTTEFTAQEADGTVEVAFDVDTTGIAGKELVAFETASDEGGATIVEHADLANEDQTVYVQEEPDAPPEEPEEPEETPVLEENSEEQPAADAPEEKSVLASPGATGDAARGALLVAVAAAAAANLAFLYASRKRRAEEAGAEQGE